MNKNVFDLTGGIAIVTGSSSGLGQQMGRALARAGADLVITSRHVESLEAFNTEIETLGRKALPLELEVRNYESIQKMVNAAYKAYGRIDILVNNAGCNARKPPLKITWDNWNLVLDTNLRGTFFCCPISGQEDDPPTIRKDYQCWLNNDCIWFWRSASPTVQAGVGSNNLR